MSVDDINASDEATPPALDDGPLGPLPRLSSRQARLESRLARLTSEEGLPGALGWLGEALGAGLVVGAPETRWHAAGMRRAGVIVQLGWPRLKTRVGLGLDATIAHAIVDRMLGFDRLPGEGRLSVSPVEWGILTYIVSEGLRRLAAGPRGALGPWDLSVDRVGPDPFDASGLGGLITLRWPITVGDVEGSLRVWLPEGLVARWITLGSTVAASSTAPAGSSREWSAVWRAEAGTIALPRGLKTLRAGGVLPLLDSRLRGTPQSPSGPVALTIDLAGRLGRWTVPAEPVPISGGGRLTLTGPPRPVSTPREAIAVSAPSPSPTTPTEPNPSAADLPVTLIVELGRLNLPLGRLADLKPGDVVELGRHSREPVELTSGGRLVARGELVLIDTELGVRVIQVFL